MREEPVLHVDGHAEQPVEHALHRRLLGVHPRREAVVLRHLEVLLPLVLMDTLVVTQSIMMTSSIMSTVLLPLVLMNTPVVTSHILR